MKKNIFLFMMGLCSLGLHAQSSSSLSTSVRRNVSSGATLENVTNTIHFSYDEAGNCIQRSNVLNTSKRLNLAPQFRNKSALINDNFATVDLSNNNDVTVRLPIPPKDGGQVSVYSLSGIMISSTDINSIKTTLSIESQPAGVYLVNVTIDGITKNFKISKP